MTSQPDPARYGSYVTVGSVRGPLPAAVHGLDPATSHEAIARHTLSGKRQTNSELVLLAVDAHPWSTAYEIGEWTGLGRIEAARRLSDLKLLGQVQRGPKRKRSASSPAEVTWGTVGE